MNGRAVLAFGATRLRLRGAGALLLGLGAGLWPLALPEGALPPEVGMRVGTTLAGAVVALVVTYGAVSRDVRSGALLLWIQKPGRPAAHYGTRLLTFLALTLLLHATLGASLAMAGSAVAPRSAGTVASLVLADLSAVALVFLVSALGPPVEALVSLLVLALLLLVAPAAFVEPESFGRWAPALGTLRAPTVETVALARWIDGLGVRPTAPALLRPLLYPAAVVGAALLLVELRVRGTGGWRRGGGQADGGDPGGAADR